MAAGEGFEIKNLLAAICYSLLSRVIPLENSHFICYYVLPQFISCYPVKV